MDRIFAAENLIGEAEALCKKFVAKCEDGRARSVETQKDCREFLKNLKKYNDEYGEVI